MTGWRDEQGTAPTELALLTPVLMLFVLFVVFVGRLATAQLDVTAAARDAARAASLRAQPADATADARITATRALADRGVTCHALTVTVDISDLQPGGTIHVTVACDTDLADLAILRVPGSHRVSATATEVIDRYGIQS